MAKFNRRLYDLALSQIARGVWTADSDEGVVWSRRTRQPLRAFVTRQGYRRIAVYDPSRNTCHNVFLHRVIWESVHGAGPEGLEINHKDGDKSRNMISNLELVTPSGNIQHAVRTGLRVAASGERQGAVKLTEQDVAEIRVLADHGQISQRGIARLYGVSAMAVSHIVFGKTWKHVPWPDGVQVRTQGRSRGELRSQARLTEQQVLEIRDLLGQGLTQRAVADRFGVTQTLISQIKLKQIWAHVI